MIRRSDHIREVSDGETAQKGVGISRQRPRLDLSTATKSYIRTRSPLPPDHALTTVAMARILGKKTTSCCPVGVYGRGFRPVHIVIFIISTLTRTSLAPDSLAPPFIKRRGAHPLQNLRCESFFPWPNTTFHGYPKPHGCCANAPPGSCAWCGCNLLCQSCQLFLELL